MTLPIELQRVPEETTVVGNMDEIVEYIESGRAYLDWNIQYAKRLKLLDDLYQEG